jgi:hypothetical protein
MKKEVRYGEEQNFNLIKKEMSIWRKSVLYNKVPIFYLSHYSLVKRFKENKKDTSTNENIALYTKKQMI